MPTQTSIPFQQYTSPVKNKVRYNNQDYEVAVSLLNPDGSFFPINTAGIVSLVIEEDTHLWYRKGSIILANSENVLERRPNETIDESQNYKFRNDGRDILYVNIKPTTTNIIVGNDPFPSDFWELSYIFVVYDTEDILTGDTTRDKNIKLYLWELDYQVFLETTSNWSTNDVLYNINPELNGQSSLLSDEDRKVYTGLALQNLIKTTLDTRTGVQKFSDQWDPGASKIFYAPPTCTYAQEDLEYIFHRHVSSKKFGNIDGDIPILFRERFDKTWNLTSIAAYFKGAVTNRQNAGPLQREQFLISTQNAATSIIPILRKTPQDTTGNLNIDLGVIGAVNNFQFVDMASFDNTFLFVNTPCSSHNQSEKQFNIDFENNSIESIKNYFQTNYIDSFITSNKPKALLALNKSKTESKVVRHVFSYRNNPIERYADSRNLILKSGLFLNQCLNFIVRGSTFRQANVFIGLDRKASQIDSNFDEKLLGQWFVTKVIHQFTADGYTNNITAIKPFADKDIRIQDNVT